MKRCLVLACAVAVCGAANAADRILSADGLAPLMIGSSVPQLQQALGRKISYNPYAGCSIVSDDQGQAQGVSYLIEEKRVTRINVEYYGNSSHALAVRTAAGIGLGSTEDEVMKAYENHVRVEPFDGDPSWHHLYVDEPGNRRGLAFDTDGKKVKSMRAGEYPALRYTNGCR